MMKVLSIEKLSKNFGGLQALNDISFYVEAGEKFVIIGPNGAGKTTLFNVINGLLPPTQGRISFFNQDITHIPSHRRMRLGLSRSFQANRLLFDLTVLENILLAIQSTQSCRFHFFRPIAAHDGLLSKAKIFLDKVDLWEKRNEHAKNISYGEQRKMEIALSLAQEPKLMLLDEPSSGLTPMESVTMVEIIQNLGRDITVIVVAHDMDLVFSVADRIMVLHYGEIIAEGKPREIQTNAKVKEIYLGVGSHNGNVGGH